MALECCIRRPWTWAFAPPRRHPIFTISKSVVERALRHVEEGTKTVLLHAGLPPQWWPFAAKYFCFACNLDESQGPSPWSKRHGSMAFTGVRCPFGALVEFCLPGPTPCQPPESIPRRTSGLFLGYYVHPGGHFNGEYLCISLTDLAAAQHAPDGRPLHPRVHRVREVFLMTDDITFPAHETLRPKGGNRYCQADSHAS